MGFLGATQISDISDNVYWHFISRGRRDVGLIVSCVDQYYKSGRDFRW